MTNRRSTGRLRIIGGQLRGSRLSSPAGLSVRPTADRVREALFDVLGDLVVGCRFLDLYAGSGAVGIEALSRGARVVTFVERDRHAVEVIRANLDHSLAPLAGPDAASSPGARLLPMDVRPALAGLERDAEQFDLVFLDPPYGGGELERGLRLLARGRLLADGAVVIAEHHARDAPPASRGLEPARTISYGRAALTQYRIAAAHPVAFDTPRGGR